MIRGDLPAAVIGNGDGVGPAVAEVLWPLAAVGVAVGAGLVDWAATPAAAPHPATSAATTANAAARRTPGAWEPRPRGPGCLILTCRKSSGHCGASHADLPKHRPIARAARAARDGRSVEAAGQPRAEWPVLRA